MKTSFILLTFLILFALFSRLFLLSIIPTGITPDELDYVLNSKSIFLTGSDLSGLWNPFSLTPPPFENPKAELPYVLMSPFIGPLPFSLFNTRLPYVILNIIFIGIMYLISRKLFNEKVALITGLFMTINPWNFYFGRTMYDTMIAVTFYFVSLYILLVAKRWYILLSFPFLFIAFYSYIGTKLLFIPLVLIAVFYAWFVQNKKQYTKQYLLLLLLSLITIFYFIFSLKTGQVNGINVRSSDILLPTSPAISSDVNDYRKLTILNPLTPIFVNKFTEHLKYTTHLYLGTFSPNILFTSGEYSPFITIKNHGFFYIIDVVFLLIGFAILFKYKFKVWLFLLGLILLGPLPSSLSQVGTSYGIRSALTYPLLIVIISFGVYKTILAVTNIKYRIVLGSLIVLIYLISFMNYMFLYTMQFPIYSSEPQGFNDRVLIKYLTFANSQNKEVLVIEGGRIPSLYKQYLFYNDHLNKETISTVRQSVLQNKYALGNIVFGNCPSNPEEYKNKTIVSTPGSKCKIPKNSKNISITRLSDGGEVYTINNDKICTSVELPKYITNDSLENFDLDSMTLTQFCKKLIVSYN